MTETPGNYTAKKKAHRICLICERTDLAEAGAGKKILGAWAITHAVEPIGICENCALQVVNIMLAAPETPAIAKFIEMHRAMQRGQSFISLRKF